MSDSFLQTVIIVNFTLNWTRMCFKKSEISTIIDEIKQNLSKVIACLNFQNKYAVYMNKYPRAGHDAWQFCLKAYLLGHLFHIFHRFVTNAFFLHTSLEPFFRRVFFYFQYKISLCIEFVQLLPKRYTKVQSRWITRKKH